LGFLKKLSKHKSGLKKKESLFFLQTIIDSAFEKERRKKSALFFKIIKQKRFLKKLKVSLYPHTII